MPKKLITELTTEELLASVDGQKAVETVYNWNTDLLDFISFYQLKVGEDRIAIKLLYKLYSHWSKDPIAYHFFHQNITDIFPSVRYGSRFVVTLNKSSIDVSQEVYKYLEKMDKTKIKNYTQHFNKFLKFYDIERGTLFIPSNALFNMYDSWCYANKARHSLSLVQFNKFCRVFFEHKKIQDRLWLRVNDSIQKHFSEEIIQLIKQKATRNGKKNTTKRSKISSP